MSFYTTQTDFLAGKQWTSEGHKNKSIRYFNGRKYEVHTSHSFMSATHTWRGETHQIYWLQWYRAVYLADEPIKIVGGWKTFTSRSVPMDGPSLMGRALNDMVPDDMQAIPF